MEPDNDNTCNCGDKNRRSLNRSKSFLAYTWCVHLARDLLYATSVREAGAILGVLFVCWFCHQASGQGIVMFDDDFFERTSGKAEVRPRANPSDRAQFGCTSVVGRKQSKRLVRKLRRYCRGDVRRLFKRRRQRFVHPNSGGSEEYFEVCCLRKGSRYQSPRWQ